MLHGQLEQTRMLPEDSGATPKPVVVDLESRSVDADNPNVEIIHRGKYESLTKQQRRWLKRRQAVEPAIGHLKSAPNGSLLVTGETGRCSPWTEGSFLPFLLLQSVSFIRGEQLRIDVNPLA